jgi:hypothetical protein
VAWGYRSTADDEPETPDYSGVHDYAEDEPDYSSMSDEELAGHANNHPDQGGLRQDILPDDYKQKGFKDNFRDKYNETRQALNAAEHGGGNDKGMPPPMEQISANKSAMLKNQLGKLI